jgi:hypothetical protein
MFADAEKNLADAIENLYTVFSRYFSWSKEPGCPCCTDPKLVEPMKNKKMGVLTHD